MVEKGIRGGIPSRIKGSVKFVKNTPGVFFGLRVLAHFASWGIFLA